MKMGKYIKKAKGTGDVAVMEFSFRCIGVRTRARTLALQRDAAAAMQKENPSYLQLRSRRLEKPSFLSYLTRTADDGQGKRTQSLGPNDSTKLLHDGDGRAVNSATSRSVSVKSRPSEMKALVATGEAPCRPIEERGIESETCGEASFGENVLDFDNRDSCRSTRETTPCSLMGNLDHLEAPGSTTRSTRQSENNRRAHEEARQTVAFPTTREMEEFFVGLEQQQLKRFTDKYNYDPVNDLPLPGRYEWIRLSP